MNNFYPFKRISKAISLLFEVNLVCALLKFRVSVQTNQEPSIIIIPKFTFLNN